MSTIYQHQTLQWLTMSGADSYYRRPVLMCEHLHQFKPWVDCRQHDLKASDKSGEKKKYLAHYVYVTSKIWSQVIFYLGNLRQHEIPLSPIPNYSWEHKG